MNTTLPIEPFRLALKYDPETGFLIWKRSAGRRGKVGNVAGSINNWGYQTVFVDGHGALAHRVVWALHAGAWPSSQIDHINGNKLDNRIENLRIVTQSENMQNIVSVRGHSKSGFRGVYQNRWGGWYSKIRVNKKAIYLGVFAEPEKAYEAYLEAKSKYHPGFVIRSFGNVCGEWDRDCDRYLSV